MKPNAKICTVAEVNAAARAVIEDGFPNIWVAGEVSGYKRHAASGHCYFTLKDSEATLCATLWRGNALRLRFQPADGMSVLVRGKLTVYPPRGQYQIDVAELHPQGEGALDLALRQLREKLFARGW